MRHGLVAGLLACTVIFGPERFPLDGGIHTELRVSVCTDTGWSGQEAAVVVETRTYERTQNTDGGYTISMLSRGDDGWTVAAKTPLAVTTGGGPKP